MSIKYKLKKIAVRWRKRMPKDLGLTEVQQKAYDTTIQVISDKESNLSISPMSAKRIVKRSFLNENNETENVFITLNRNHLLVINGVYHYDIYVDDRIRDHIIDKFDDKLERKINAMENQINSSVIKSLDEVMKKINKSKEKNN